MGRGNWCPSDTNGNTVTENLVYVDVIDLMNAPEDRDEAFYDDAWEQFREDLREALPKSFGKAEDQDTRAFCHSRDTSPLFANKLCYLVIDCQGELYHLGISFVARENAPSFAQDHIAKVSKKVFDALAKYYHLSFRDGAWMSRPYPIQHKKSPAELQP
jgi:hypothetical protein